jgi:uncharacterized protein YbbK (DUF523 family)
VLALIIVSACLAGFDCRFNGKNSRNEKIVEMVSKGEAIPVCPEQLGGLPTPRARAEIIGGTGQDVFYGKAEVRTDDGRDISSFFIKGAEEVLKLARIINATKAILRDRSPACGCGKIYDGTFLGKLIEGDGVLTAFLRRHGIEVQSAESLK